MNLSEKFNQQEFTNWVENFLPGFSVDSRKVDVQNSFKGVKSIQTIGESSLGVRVYIIKTDLDPSNRKVGLATESFSLLKNYGSPNALIAYFSDDSPNWRLSLLTSTPIWNEGKIITKLSNPKRQSYILGPKAKVKTPFLYLIGREKVLDFNDLKSRFSLEVVNKDFYKEISKAFSMLVGGTLINGKSKKSYEPLLQLPSVNDHSQTSLEFAVRLIGRIIFCWFLREKRSTSGHSLMPKELLSHEASTKTKDYYHNIIEPIFFEILNKPIKSRKESFINELFSAIPYLNGGLFSPHDDDFFSYNEGKQAINHNLVSIPDNWFSSFFEVLETYNFTIDENTSFDEELSIDPEMLGRIFENLLAEINPETGESARKSTGSYYTPRTIVDYMVDESLFLYLKEKTSVNESVLRSLISYDLEDDIQNPLNQEQKDKIATALSTIKILDPACGSGAFPIGALQKIVFILQQIDPHGQLWFKKQLQNTSVELRRVIEREFNEKNFDYIRKLGVIRENIYGIDIQPIATEISRLRCFLTLVVDERIDENLENRGIEPLPNLDFKFVTANTLTSLPNTVTSASQMGLFEDDQGIKDLKEVRDMFFNASGFERDQLKLQFVQTQNRMFQKLISEGLRGHADMTAKLTSWDPFSHKAADWFDPEWMFGIKSGFDIVIANPPYGIIFNKEQKLSYENKYSSFKRNNDIFVAFYSRGIELLNISGLLTFISPNTFLNGDYFAKLREEIFLKTKIESITDYKNLNIFADPTVFVCVFICRKEFSSPILQNYSQRIADGSLDNFSTYEVKLDKPSAKFKPNNKILTKILTSKNINIVDNLFYVKDIGFNYWTIGKGKKRDGDSIGDRILYEGARLNSDDIPFLKGRDIDKYFHSEPTNFLRNNYKEFLRKNDVFRYSEDFINIKPKIIYRQTSNKIIASLDNSSLYLDKTVHMITPKRTDIKFDLKYTLALLNSKLFYYLYKYISQESEGRTFSQVKTTYIKQLPIKFPPQEIQDLIIEKVDQILEFKKTKQENKQDEKISTIESDIDRLIYNIYDLSEEEIQIVEENK